MVRTAYMLGFLALVAAGVILAHVVWDQPYAGRLLDDGLGDFLVERLSRTGDGLSQDDRQHVSTLVQEAETFSLYLNPPAPVAQEPARVAARSPDPARVGRPVAPINSMPKFELHGISYHRARPENSMALVWEPGNGHRWVKLGAELGHLVLKEINGDSIVCQAGDSEQTIALTKVPSSKQYAQESPSTPSGAPQSQSLALRPEARQRANLAAPARVASSTMLEDRADNYRQAIAVQNRRRYERSVRMP